MLVAITPDTLESVLPLAAAFLAESKLDLDWDKAHWLATWSNFLSLGLGVMYCDKDRQGWIAGLITPEVISGKLATQEVYWYVMPAQRHTRLGVELFDALEAEAIKRACVRIAFGSLANLPPTVQKFYARRGYAPLETHYVKNL